MASWEECNVRLALENRAAAFWTQRIADIAGTYDADWEIFKAAGVLLAEIDAESQNWHNKYFILQKKIKEAIDGLV